MTPAERDEEDRVTLATWRMTGVAMLVLVAAMAALATAGALHLARDLRTPSSVPDRQDVQIGTVCPDVTGGAS